MDPLTIIGHSLAPSLAMKCLPKARMFTTEQNFKKVLQSIIKQSTQIMGKNAELLSFE